MDGDEPPTIEEESEEVTTTVEGEPGEVVEGEGDAIPEVVAPEEPLSQLKEEPEEEETEVPVEPVDSLASTIPPEATRKGITSN